MPAQVVECNNEDGTLICEVQYYTPLPRIQVTPAARDAFIELQKAAITKLDCRVICSCLICGDDAQYHIEEPEPFTEDFAYVCQECFLYARHEITKISQLNTL